MLKKTERSARTNEVNMMTDMEVGENKKRK